MAWVGLYACATDAQWDTQECFLGDVVLQETLHTGWPQHTVMLNADFKPYKSYEHRFWHAFWTAENPDDGLVFSHPQSVHTSVEAPSFGRYVFYLNIAMPGASCKKKVVWHVSDLQGMPSFKKKYLFKETSTHNIEIPWGGSYVVEMNHGLPYTLDGVVYPEGVYRHTFFLSEGAHTFSLEDASYEASPSSVTVWGPVEKWRSTEDKHKAYYWYEDVLNATSHMYVYDVLERTHTHVWSFSWEKNGLFLGDMFVLSKGSLKKVVVVQKGSKGIHVFDASSNVFLHSIQTPFVYTDAILIKSQGVVRISNNTKGVYADVDLLGSSRIETHPMDFTKKWFVEDSFSQEPTAFNTAKPLIEGMYKEKTFHAPVCVDARCEGIKQCGGVGDVFWGDTNPTLYALCTGSLAGFVDMFDLVSSDNSVVRKQAGGSAVYRSLEGRYVFFVDASEHPHMRVYDMHQNPFMESYEEVYFPSPYGFKKPVFILSKEGFWSLFWVSSDRLLWEYSMETKTWKKHEGYAVLDVFSADTRYIFAHTANKPVVWDTEEQRWISETVSMGKPSLVLAIP